MVGRFQRRNADECNCINKNKRKSIITDVHIWLFISYIFGTCAVIFLVKSKFNIDTTKIIEATIDKLITDDYIKAKKLPSGEVELIRHNEI